MITIDQINALRKRIEDLRGYLSIDEKAIEIAEEEKRTQDPEFWTNSKEAELVMKRIRTLKTWTGSFNDCLGSLEDAQVLFEFMKAGEADEAEFTTAFESAIKAVEELEFKNMLSAEEDNLNAVMQITSGAGGTESCDWAAMLMRMYRMYGDRAHSRSRNWTCKKAMLPESSRSHWSLMETLRLECSKGKTGFIGWFGSAHLTARRGDTLLLFPFTSIPWWMIRLKLRSMLPTSVGTPSARGVQGVKM
jgi:protein subunit release factor A